MEAIDLLSLTVVTGIVALGLLAAEVAHAQAPSGPITAVPQPAGAPVANVPNPVPLPAPRTTILGAWKFNPDESDDPRRRREDSKGSNGGYGGGRGRMGGSGGGYGGRRGGEQKSGHHFGFPSLGIYDSRGRRVPGLDLADDPDRLSMDSGLHRRLVFGECLDAE